MSDLIEIRFEGRPLRVVKGMTIASALANAGMLVLRRSVTGEPRGALCAMGICQECRMTVDGISHRRACMTPVADGMILDREPMDD